MQGIPTKTLLKLIYYLYVVVRMFNFVDSFSKVSRISINKQNISMERTGDGDNYMDIRKSFKVAVLGGFCVLFLSGYFLTNNTSAVLLFIWFFSGSYMVKNSTYPNCLKPLNSNSINLWDVIVSGKCQRCR